MMAYSTPDTFPSPAHPTRTRFFVILAVAMIVVLAGSVWWMNRHLYAAPFTPTHLTTAEQQVLDGKLDRLRERPTPDHIPRNAPSAPDSTDGNGPLTPEPYREDPNAREIHISEKELNALIARDPEAAKYVAVDLADDLMSLKWLIPVNDEFPVFGGTTLRINVGVTLKYEQDKPVVIVRGMSLGGVPLPKAWWGDIKNVNLVEEFHGENGFWDQLSRGVDYINVQDGQLWLRLKE